MAGGILATLGLGIIALYTSMVRLRCPPLPNSNSTR
jgi:hypothetical protein